MPYKEREIEKIYYTIGEVAKALGATTSIIRYYERHFGIQTERDRKGNRVYNVKGIGQMALVMRLTSWLLLPRAIEIYKRGEGEEKMRMLEPRVKEPLMKVS